MKFRGLTTVVAAVAALTLTGCLGDVPRTGPIQYGRENSDRGQENFVRAIVSPPAPGADPVGIVRGFLAAAAADDDEYKTARLFLTGQVRDSWNPQGPRRIVDDRSVALEYDNLRSPGSVLYRADEVGELTSDGLLVERKTAQIEQFRLVLVEKEWRIAALPDGITITQSEFERTFRQVRLYFPTPSLQQLVPISVYVPIRPGLATSLVRALLGGPVGWLAPALTTAFPKGSALANDVVPVINGIASVDLNAAAATAPSSRRNVMAAQLNQTLSQIREFKEVRLTVGGTNVSASRLQPANREPILNFTNDRGLAWQRIGGPVQYYASTTSDYIKGFTAPVLSPDRTYLLAIDSAGGLATGNVTRVLNGQQNAFQINGLTTVLQPVGRLAPAQWDADGNYWIFDRATPVRIWTGRRTDVPVRVNLPNEFASTYVESAAISPDGVRLILGVRSGRSSTLFMLRVVRTSNAVSAQAPRLVYSSSDSMSAAAFTRDQIILLSGKRRLVTIDTEQFQQTGSISVPSSLALTAQSGAPIIIETDDHRLLVRRGQSWSLITTGRDPNYGG